MPVWAQTPRINTFFPDGGRAGSTLEVEIRGSSLGGADRLLASGTGVSGSIDPTVSKVDETNKPLWQAKCQSCHELRSPANRSLSPAQWAATVDRMVKVHQAPLSAEEAAKVTEYLVGAARAGRVTAKLKIAPDTLPGIYELRVASPQGISTARLFEVGNLPEAMGVPGDISQPQPITLPCVANGTLADTGERDYFKFSAQQGKRYVFNLKAFRYNDETQMYFNPELRLYDSSGKELVENHGYYELDPLIDWTCPQTGDYTLEVRDLLGKANPSSVYRLTMGAVPYDTALFPPAARTGSRVYVSIVGKDLTESAKPFELQAPTVTGLTTVSSPWGPQPFYISSSPIVLDSESPHVIQLPAGFAGRIQSAGRADTFTIQGSGRWEFEVYADRLGSQGSFNVRLLNDAGRGLAGTSGDNRFNADLQAGKTYRIEVKDTSGQSGPDHLYFVEARPVNSRLACVVRPDNLTLRAGAATVAEVILTARDGVQGDVEVTAEDLPPGVTAAPALIPPDRDRTYLLLTAAADAPLDAHPITIRATAKTDSGPVSARAVPQEEYRIFGNGPEYKDRQECVAGVCGPAEFKPALLTGSPLHVDTKKGVEVKVKIQRNSGFKEGMTARIVGLPSGWTADYEGVPPNKDEVTLLVRPDGNDRRPFLKRDKMLTPITSVVELISGDVPYAAGVLTVARPEGITDDEKESK